MTLKIALSMNYQQLENGRQRAYLDKEYFDYLAAYDAIAVPIVQMPDDALSDEKIDSLLDDCDGIIFTGGGDIDPTGVILDIDARITTPTNTDTDTTTNADSDVDVDIAAATVDNTADVSLCTRTHHATTSHVDKNVAVTTTANQYDWTVYRQDCLLHPRRQAFEFRLYRRTLSKKMPLLAICLGIQLINVAHGGSLYGHLADDFTNKQGKKVEHGGLGVGTNHKVNIEPLSKLGDLLGTDSVEVNSFHHQGIKKLGHGLIATAKSDDGLVEALELSDTTCDDSTYRTTCHNYPFFLAVQWHPERQPDSTASKKLMTAFLRAAAAAKQK